MRRTLAALVFAIACVPRPALSDGIVMKSHMDGWRPAAENSQQALITYRDGIERLIVAIEVDGADAKSLVWLLPVPAPAKQVHVDVLARFPRVHGREVYGGAMEHVHTTMNAFFSMQIWPPLAGVVLDALFSDRNMPRVAATKAAEAPKGERVVVHERVEKQGMISEVITATEGAALYSYLAGKGLNLKAGAVPTLEFYIGKDYTFVASWIDAEAAQAKEQGSILNRGVEIRFPTAEMFFPLYPTSGYGERVVPASIRVAGHVTPRLFADIARQTSTGYHVANSGMGEDQNPLGTDLYTKIDIDAPAKAFTQDLWISPKPPGQHWLDTATFIVRHPLAFAIAYLASVSALASLVAGSLIYGELRSRKGAVRLLLVGLGNCVSLLGMLATSIALPGSWKRRSGFLATFSLLFLTGAVVLALLVGTALVPLKPIPRPTMPPSFESAPRNPDSSTVIVVPRIVDAAPAPASPAAPVIAADIEALYQQALAMENSGKAQDAVRIYRRAARAGSGKAAKRLGDIFEYGVPGVSRDREESRQWYDTARQLGEKVER